MKSRYIPNLCTVVFLAALLPLSAQAQAPLDAEESAFLTLINNYRAANGVGALSLSPALTNSSKWMSGDMAAKNYFSHTDSLGRDPGTRIASFGYTFFPWGENIAAGNASAQSTLTQWINACDPDLSGACTYGHRNNMLNSGFKVIGIGRAAGGTYGWYWTTDFGGVVDQPQASTPVINSFAASQSSINAGQSTTLTWNVSGASSLTIDQGIGGVSASGSRAVSPVSTTTYRLTATNSSGNSVASVTIAVSTPPAADTQPPSAPAIQSAVAKASTEVDLTWAASTDNTGVAGYQIIRNGSPVASVAGSVLAWVDTGVTANSTYSYVIKAFDGAANYSLPSNTVAVTTPAISVPSPVPPAPSPAPAPSSGCPAPATNAFTGCYFNNLSLSGSPVLTRTDIQINFDWGTGTPDASVPAAFSARWQGNFDFDPAIYTFTVTASDGIRVYIDGNAFPIIDRWLDHPLSRYTAIATLSAGRHLITVEYYERTGTAAAHLSWQSSGGGGSTAAIPAISSFTAAPAAITAGQSATLSWTVSGSSSITIDNGLGDVTGATSRTVSPGVTTTYRLTAANGSGSSAASVTVTVNAPAGDTQAPSAPVISSAVAKGATEVDVTWTASTDNVGVAGYQIIRNGSAVASVGAAVRTWADIGVLGSSTYSYAVKAYDAAGNYSAASNVAAATTGTPSVPSGCLAPATNAFTGCYFNNLSLNGNPVLVRTDNQINFDWGAGTPGPSVPAAFSARWQGSFDFDAGSYTFTAIASDGMRVYIDGNPYPVLDRWSDHPPYRFSFQSAFSLGRHLITVEYYQQTGSPAAHLSWQKNP